MIQGPLVFFLLKKIDLIHSNNHADLMGKGPKDPIVALCVENGLIGLSDLAQLADLGKLR